MTEQQIRQIVREELIREQVGGKAAREVRRFLDGAGTEKAGGYKYGGYFFSTDRMGDAVGFVSMFRDLYDSEPAASATIDERGTVEITLGGSGPPDARIPDYRSGEAVVNKMIDLVE